MPEGALLATPSGLSARNRAPGLSRLGVTLDREPDEGGPLMLALRRRLTVYDTSNLERANRETLPPCRSRRLILTLPLPRVRKD